MYVHRLRSRTDLTFGRNAHMTNEPRGEKQLSLSAEWTSRRSVATVSIPELRDRLERTRAALAAVKRAPESESALRLETDLTREVRILERDLANA